MKTIAKFIVWSAVLFWVVAFIWLGISVGLLLMSVAGGVASWLSK